MSPDEAKRVRKLAASVFMEAELNSAFEAALAKCDVSDRWQVELAMGADLDVPGIGQNGRRELAAKLGMWLVENMPHILAGQ